jgi:hypothetical protein
VPAVGTYCLPIKESSPLLGLLWSSFGACSFTIDDVALIKE